jgi:hypothetical protein
MGLFNFFTRKADPVTVYKGNNNSFELLNEGILFEENATFLKWGTDIEEAIKKIQGRKERRSDRTIYRWGEQTILDGLKLDLTTILWDGQAEDDSKRLYSIGFWSIGDKTAENYIEDISTHLEAKLGSPLRKDSNGQDISLEWRVKDVRLSLNYFERHSYKLHFEIRKI